MAGKQSKPFTIHQRQVKPFIAPTADHRLLWAVLSPDRDGTLPGASIGVVELPAGSPPPPHQHEVEQEAWYVFEGKGQIKVGDQVIDVEPGSVVVSPPKMPHSLINPGPGPLKAVFIFTPSGPEKALIVE